MTAAAQPTPSELTLRSIVLGAVLTAVFTAANVYLGLRIGLTFATSIPAAVISMAVLRLLPGATIQENNIVQTIASAAGTLSAIVFVLPGLIMVGWWSGFPYWQSAAVIAIGGVLGVMYSVPLRRALVSGSDLPYPEGVAAAEVLKVGAGEGGAEENRQGLGAVIAGSLLSVAYPLLGKLKLVAEGAKTIIPVGAGGTSLSAGLSLALLGVGHLVGLAVGIAMLVGIVLSFGFLLPAYTAAGAPSGTELADFIADVFRHKIRFIGVGTISLAAVWTLLKVIGPIVRGIAAAIAADRARKGGGMASLDLTERDLPIGIVGGTIALLMVPIAALLAGFAVGGPVSPGGIALTVGYVLVAGVIIASVCGYMAGLIGASNSPISGIGILAVLGIALILAALYGRNGGGDTRALVAFALFVTSIVFGVATISNDNLQDLKTGQLVGATPWRQQVALVLGVVFGALVIPPILSLLNTTFGFQGAPGVLPNAGKDALAAPQAALISAIAQGVLGGNLDWSLIGLGGLIGVVVIGIDEVLRKTGKGSLPPLAVGMGMYLPMDVTGMVVVGAVLGHLYNRWAARQPRTEFAERMGVLTATGLIVGDGLFNIAYAAIVGATNNADILAITAESAWTTPVGIVVFAAFAAYAYRRMVVAAHG